MSQVDLSKVKPGVLAEAYVTLRDEKRALEAAAKKISAKMDVLSGLIMGKMDELEQDAFSAFGHSVYKSEITSASLSDREAVRDFVIANDAWQLVDLKANAKATEEYYETYQVMPPGIVLNKIIRLGVRKVK